MVAATRKAPDGRQVRWAQHNRARRQVILDAALEVIGEAAPGEEVHVQEIAERAGLSRTVVYRHFVDRADLDRAVQGDIVDLVRRELLPALTLEGTPVAIIHRILEAYVGWAVEHQSLHRFVERELGDGGVSVIDQAVSEFAGRIEQLIVLAVETLGTRVDRASAQALDPLVFGLVGAGFGAVRRWLGRPVVEPSREELVALLTEAVWHQVAGLAAARGLVLDPDVPVGDLTTATAKEDQ